MRKAVSLLLLVPLLVGCSPEKPTGGASPTPSASSTTPASSSQSPTAQVSADPSQDPLYLEAVTVYRAYFAELTKAEMSGFKPKSLSPMIDPYIASPLRELVDAGYRGDREAGIRPMGNRPALITATAPNPGVSRDQSLTSLRVCIDATHVQVVDAQTGASRGTGRRTYKELYFKRFNGSLKGFAQDSRVVDKCPI